MVDKIKALIFVQTALIVVLLVFLVFNIRITTKLNGGSNDFLALATQYNPDETRASVISFEPLRDSMEKFFAENKLDAAVYVVNMRNGVNLGINENEGAFPASLNKIPVSIVVMREVEKGNLKLDTKIPIDIDKIQSNTVIFSTNSDVIRLTQDEGDIYKNNKELTVRELLENMLKKSDNNALRLLTAQIDREDLLEFYSYVDVDAYGSYDYSKSGQRNRLLSAKALSNIFLSLYHSTILEPENSQYILSLLADTTFDARKIAMLPPYTKVAHKFGAYDDAKTEHLFRDCGIIYSGKSRILYCIVIKNQEKDEAIRMTGRLIRAIHSYVIDNEITLDDYKARNRNSAI